MSSSSDNLGVSFLFSKLMVEDCKLLRFECWEFVGVRLSEWKEDNKLALEISVDGDPKDIRLKRGCG